MEYNYEYEVQCATCGSDAPVAWFERPFILRKDGDPKTWYLCEVCASTFVGNTIMYKSVYSQEARDAAVLLAQVANHLLDKLTKRRKDHKEEG